jgi:hypothetical protein
MFKTYRLITEREASRPVPAAVLIAKDGIEPLIHFDCEQWSQLCADVNKGKGKWRWSVTFPMPQRVDENTTNPEAKLAHLRILLDEVEFYLVPSGLECICTTSQQLRWGGSRFQELL